MWNTIFYIQPIHTKLFERFLSNPTQTIRGLKIQLGGISRLHYSTV